LNPPDEFFRIQLKRDLTLNVLLLFDRLCSLFLVPSAAFVAAVLFAVHPIHTEAVSGFLPFSFISSRDTRPMSWQRVTSATVSQQRRRHGPRR